MENRAAVFTSQPQAVEVYQAGAWWAGELLGWRHDADGSCQVWVRVVLGGVEETAWTDLSTLRLPERHLSVAQPTASVRGPATQEMSVARHPSGRRARSEDVDAQATAGMPAVRDLSVVPDLPSAGGRRTADETAQFASVGRRRAPDTAESPAVGRRRAPETGQSPAVGRRRAPEGVAATPARPGVAGRHRAPGDLGRHRTADTGLLPVVPGAEPSVEDRAQPTARGSRPAPPVHTPRADAPEARAREAWTPPRRSRARDAHSPDAAERPRAARPPSAGRRVGRRRLSRLRADGGTGTSVGSAGGVRDILGAPQHPCCRRPRQ
jgi:hypothetical protein